MQIQICRSRRFWYQLLDALARSTATVLVTKPLVAPNFDFVCTKMNVDFFSTKIIALPVDILELLDEKDDFTVKHETAVTPNHKKSALAYPRDEIL